MEYSAKSQANVHTVLFAVASAEMAGQTARFTALQTNKNSRPISRPSSGQNETADETLANVEASDGGNLL